MFKNWDSDPEVAKYTLWVAHENVETTKMLVDMWLQEEKPPSNRIAKKKWMGLFYPVHFYPSTSCMELF